MLIAKESERKALQDILRDVNTAFWRAAAGQRMMTRVYSLAKDLKLAIKASRQMERTRATDVLSAVAFRRDIVDSVRTALSVQRELREAKTGLGELLNIRPGTDFTLALPAAGVRVPYLPMSLKKMETFALQNRPELRIEDYNERISDWQAREALYNLLPGLKVNAGVNYSSETANLSPNWISTGLNLGMNIFRLFSGSSEIEAAEQRGELARQQRLAMSLAVLTQLHMAYIKFRDAAQQSRLAREIADSDRRLTRLVRAEGKFLKHDFFERVRLSTQQLRSELEEQRSHVELVSAHAELMHSIGLDVFPDNIPVNDIAALTGAIHSVTARWEVSSDQIDQPTATPIDRLVNSMVSQPQTTKKRPPTKTAAKMLPRNKSTNGRIEITDEIARRLSRIAPASGGDAMAGNADGEAWELSLTLPGMARKNERPAQSKGKRPYIVSLGAFKQDLNAIDMLIEMMLRPVAALDKTDITIAYRSNLHGKKFYFVETAAIRRYGQARRLCAKLKKDGRPCMVATKRY